MPDDEFKFEVRGPVEGQPLPRLEPVETTGESSQFDVRGPIQTTAAPSSGAQDTMGQAIAGAAGATLGRLGRSEAAKQTMDAIMQLRMEAAQRAEAYRQAEELMRTGRSAPTIQDIMRGGDQSALERQLQGTVEDRVGTTGRSRGEAYNTEEARRAAARRGVNTPFTNQAWAATKQGVLFPSEAAMRIEEELMREAAQEAARARGAGFTGAIRRVAAPIGEAMVHAPYLGKALGTLGGLSAGLEGYQAYKEAREGKPGQALLSGLSALGGVGMMVPFPPVQVVSGGLAFGIPAARALGNYLYPEDQQEQQRRSAMGAPR
jgi:hypothetical protein